MDGAVCGPRPALEGEQLRLQLLQLQCIIDSKDREIHLLRKQLSTQEEADEVAALHAEISQLRKEVQQLTLERNALRHSFATAAAASPRGAASTAAASPSPGGEAAHGVQQRAPGAAANGGGVLASTPRAGESVGGSGAGQPTTPTEGRAAQVYPVSPASGGNVDPGALVEKLRSLVTGLVAEALAAQHRLAGQPHPGGLIAQQLQPQAVGSAASPAPYAIAPGKLSQYQAVAMAPRSSPVDQGQQPAASPVAPVPVVQPTAAATHVTAFDSQAAGVRLAWPGVHIIVQQVQPLAPGAPGAAEPADATFGCSGETTVQPATAAPAVPAASAATTGETAAQPAPAPASQACSNSAPSTSAADVAAENGNSVPAASVTAVQAAPTAASAAPTAPPVLAAPAAPGTLTAPTTAQSVAVPDVLELNVDGTVMLVERDLLESQAAGSILYRKLVREYRALPLDAHGRPYLSYDPRAFQVLLSHLKERYLFGSVAAAPLAGLTHAAESLGVSRHYLAQVAGHFGLAIPPTVEQHGTVPAVAVAAAALYPTIAATPSGSADPIFFQAGHTSAATAPPAAPSAASLSLTAAPSSSSVSQHPGQHALAAAGASVSLPNPFQDLPAVASRQAPHVPQREVATTAAATGVPSVVSQPWGQLPSLRVPAQPDVGVDATAGQTLLAGERAGIVNVASSGLQSEPSRAFGSVPVQPDAPNGAASRSAEHVVPAPAAESGAEGSPAGAVREIVERLNNGDMASSLPTAGSAAASTPVLQAVPSCPPPQPSQTQSPQALAPRASTSLPSPSRIPPPPPAQKPVPGALVAAASVPFPAAPGAVVTAASTAAAAPLADAAAPGAASAGADSKVPGWWQPFPDGPAADAVTAAAPDTTGPAVLNPTASVQDSGAAAANGEAALPAVPVAFAAAAVTVPQEPPTSTADPQVAAAAAAAAAPPGADSAAAVAAAARAAAEARYKVPNLYAVLAEKRRAELEADSGAGA